MAWTVSAAFERFRQNIELPGDHRDVAATRRDWIVSALGGKFDVLEAFPFGSIPKFTAVTGHADIDILVALHYGKHIKDRTPAAVLQDIRDALSPYGGTVVRKNGQAVTLYYKSWPNVDVVPATRVLDGSGVVSHYEIPNMKTGQWIQTNPKGHAALLTAKNAACGESFKRIIKMVKWWNYGHGEYLQSFHIESIAADLFSAQIDDYTWSVFQFFERAAKEIADYGLCGGAFLSGYLDWQEREAAVQRLNTAVVKSRDAWHLTYNGRGQHEQAIRVWRQIFGDAFPTYGA